MKIGDVVEWTTQQYWSTKHPDECGYNTIHNRGVVINWDTETIVVSECKPNSMIRFLNIEKTAWLPGKPT